MTSKETLKGSPNPAAAKPGEQSPPGADAGARPGRLRRVSMWVWGWAGALVVLVYGLAVERMRGPPLIMLMLGGMTLALTAGALLRMIDPLARPDAGEPAGGSSRRVVRELEREKFLVLKAIKEIELDFQMRKISDRDYREMVERYRNRAMRLISELESGDDYRGLIEKELKLRLDLPVTDAPTAATVPAAAVPAAVEPAVIKKPTCRTCQTANDADAKFCKSCGGKL